MLTAGWEESEGAGRRVGRWKGDGQGDVKGDTLSVEAASREFRMWLMFQKTWQNPPKINSFEAEFCF